LGTQSLSALVRELWWLLDGPASLAGSALVEARNQPEALAADSRVALENVEVFLQALEQQQQNSDGIQVNLWDQKALNELLESLYAKADVSDQSRGIELMTMHKSKGLEFDVVILPSLDRIPRSDDSQLLSWFEFTHVEAAQWREDATNKALPAKATAESLMVLSPFDQRGSKKKSALTELLKRFEKEKSQYEVARLFYVAATRAKQELHLFANIPFDPKLDSDNQWQMPKAPAGSILETMWALLQNDVQQLIADYQPEIARTETEAFVPKVKRLPEKFESFIDWQMLQPNQVALSKQMGCLVTPGLGFSTDSLMGSSMDSVNSTLGLFKQGGVSATVSPKSSASNAHQAQVEQGIALKEGAIFTSAIGNLVHLLCEQWVKQQLAPFAEDATYQALLKGEVTSLLQSVAERQAALEFYLKSQGIKPKQMAAAWQAVWQSIQNTLHNPKVRWALLASHQASRAEWQLQSTDQQGLREEHIVDRSFIDDQGVRWIIDYKTSHILGAGIEYNQQNVQRFITQQVEVYRPQLQRYADLIGQLEQRPQKRVLYFAYFDEWCEL